MELVESWPVETTLDHPDIRDAKDVWPEMFARAKRTIDLAEFYASDTPGSRLEPAVAALEAAVKRGVLVRFLAEEKFAKVYPQTLDRLAAAGVKIRRIPFATRAGGTGVLHAKYFIVDGEQAYLGSQNFDWRSLTHIEELGVRFTVPEAVRALQDLFNADWVYMSGADRSARFGPDHPYAFPQDGVTLVASPRGLLPDEALWDLPAIVALVDSAKRSVRVELLTFKADHDFPELEAALRRAAARGARVEVLVADWSKRKETLESLRRLHAPPALTVKLVTIPPWSGGHVPFARVAHAKYLVVDGERAWVGTSNWERDYFFQSRNVGLILQGGAVPPRLDRFFGDVWNSSYSYVLDPTVDYIVPRVGD